MAGIWPLRLKFDDLPIVPILTSEGEPVSVSVELPGREVKSRLWMIMVGRVNLYLLDTDVEGNSSNDRDLSARLYNSDLDLRISQEIILGVGGVRALRMLGYNPSVWHMNEGHSGFLTLERAREKVASGHTLDEAIASIRASIYSQPTHQFRLVMTNFPCG